MVISFKKLIVPVVIFAAAAVLLILIINACLYKTVSVTVLMGGTVHTLSVDKSDYTSVFNDDSDVDYSERYQRPSKDKALYNKYSFGDFEKNDDKPPLITTAFNAPDDVIMAYFSIIKDAENMDGYLGGCGTIGNALEPYPYAYELYTAGTKNKMPLKEFIDSFKGIGHTTLLKLYPAYLPPKTPDNIRYYMFEAEVITGPSEKDSISYKRGGSYFAYYYGLITTEYNPQTGWKIKSIDYLPEDFLCAPTHGWAFSADYFVSNVYKDWYKLIDKIDKKVEKGSMVYIYASNKNKKYRFDFVRLTNGNDKLLHENIFENGRWKEVNLLKTRIKD